MLNKTHQKQILELASKLLDETIAPEDFQRLECLLAASQKNREYYLEIIRIESLLHWEQEASQDQSKVTQKIIPFPLFPAILSAAAVFVALLAGWWAFIQVGSETKSGFTPGMPLAASTSPEHNAVINSSTKKTAKESFNPQDLNPSSLAYTHTPEKLVLRDYLNGVELLKDGHSSSEFGPIEKVGPIKRFSRLGELSRPAEKGILPAKGHDMIALGELQIDVDNQSAGLIEMIQILDVRDIETNIATGEVYLNAEAMVNQSLGTCQEGAEFAVSFHAFRGNELSVKDELGSWESSLQCDIDPQTWENLISSVQLPKDTEFVVVSINVRKSGMDAFVANTSSYYSDEFRLSLVDGEKVLVPFF